MTGPSGPCLLAPVRFDRADWPAAVEVDVQPWRPPAPILELSPKREAILTFIRDYIDRHGYPPTLDEIAAEVGVVSRSTAAYHVRVLRDGGWLAPSDGHSRPRALRLIKGDVA